ncbi:hypothetical protein [Nocardiopsis sp. NPDC006938]|uniref:hypothetical protein n=1 Tax=Nocardiopsis sp. NPDC006938 TaxID=3364337 RepID=UPI0036D0BDA6
MPDFDHPRNYMHAIIESLESEDTEANTRVGTALSLVVPLSLHLSSSHVPTGEVDEFRTRLTRLISGEPNFAGLYRYLGDCSDYAELGRLNGYARACLMRSVLQVFDDEFAAWSQAESAVVLEGFSEEIADIDQTLREVSDEAPPVREEEIPNWVPDSHWWWRAPRQQDMSEGERASRLEYDHWDGV